MRVAISGATGKVGGKIIDLLDGRAEVRALVRDKARAHFSPEVELAEVDYSNASSLDAALAGADAVFIMAPITMLEENTSALVASAQRMGGRRAVLLSSLSVEADDNEHAAIHKRAEAALRRSGLEWTIIRGGQFMSNTLRWADAIRARGEVRPYIRNDATAIVHPADLAAVAAEALTKPGHAGKIYGATGGECVRPSECAAILAEVLDRDIRYVELSDEEAEDAYVALFGDTPEIRAKLRSLRASDVPWEHVRADVGQVLGRPPLGYRQWAKENASVFRAGPI